jgi:hypothetical protein
MTVTNTLVYHDMELIMVVKGFIVKARLGAHPRSNPEPSTYQTSVLSNLSNTSLYLSRFGCKKNLKMSLCQTPSK